MPAAQAALLLFCCCFFCFLSRRDYYDTTDFTPLSRVFGLVRDGCVCGGRERAEAGLAEAKILAGTGKLLPLGRVLLSHVGRIFCKKEPERIFIRTFMLFVHIRAYLSWSCMFCGGGRL